MSERFSDKGLEHMHFERRCWRDGFDVLQDGDVLTVSVPKELKPQVKTSRMSKVGGVVTLDGYPYSVRMKIA